jgi:hypothetical protein
MLDFRFKSLKLVSFVIGEKHGVSIVEEYDKRSLFPMLLNATISFTLWKNLDL